MMTDRIRSGASLRTAIPLALLGLLGTLALVPRDLDGAVQENGLPDTLEGAGIEMPARSDTAVAFRHSDHELLDCLTCHETGTPTLRANRQWCSDCHHSRRTAAACTACHSSREISGATYPAGRTMEFSVGASYRRELPFRHGVHEAFSCGRCHGSGSTPDASDLECTSCHEEHHSLRADCAACHRSAPSEAHPIEAHLTCAASGCHDPSPLPEPPPRDRAVCVACHQEMTDHKPGQQCAECHVLPPSPGSGPEGGRP